jgi:hypothetical protein
MKSTIVAVLSLSIGMFIGSRANAAGGSNKSITVVALHDATLHEILLEFNGFPTMSHHADSLRAKLDAAIRDMGLPTNAAAKTPKVLGEVRFLLKGDKLQCDELVFLHVPPATSSRLIRVQYFTSKNKRSKGDFIRDTRREKLWTLVGAYPETAFEQLKAVAKYKDQGGVFALPPPPEIDSLEADSP